MGAPKVTPLEIVEMIDLYNSLGSYAEVARHLKVKRSESTVSKYVKMKDVPANIRLAVQNLLNAREK